MRTQAIIFTAPGKVETGAFDIPAPGPGQVITKTLYTGVSTGTELRVLAGRQQGAQYPLVPGYENVGEIIETGRGVKMKKGTRVFFTSSDETGPYQRTWGGQVQFGLVRESACFPLPSKADLVACTFGHTAAIAYHGIRRAKVGPKDRVAVVGQGLIGFLAGLCAKALGAEVIAVDTDEGRLDAALKAGIPHAVNAAKTDAEKAVKELTNGGVDVAVDVTGVASAVDKTGRLIRMKPWDPPFPPSGRLVILGSYNDPVQFSYYPTLFDIEPDIFPSRDCVAQDIADVLKLITSGKMNPLAISHSVRPVREAADAYQRLVEKKEVRVIFDWK
jgi:3-hydroxyethyl bacteriochlorophyllide a dehydrogenase